MPRVVTIDDHQLLAETLRLGLEMRGISCAVLVPAGCFADLHDAVRAHEPELILLDLDLGALGDATPLIGPLTRAGSRVLIVSGLEDRLRVAAALEEGAIGFCSKTAGLDVLIDTALAAL